MNKSVNNTTDNERGVALIVALMVMVLMTLLGTAAIYSSTISVQISGNERTGLQAYYAALTGIKDAEARLVGLTADTIGAVAGYEGWNDTAKEDALEHEGESDPAYDEADYDTNFVNWSVNIVSDANSFPTVDASYTATISHVRHAAGLTVAYRSGYIFYPMYRISSTGSFGSSSRSVEKVVYMNMVNLWSKAVTACGDLNIDSTGGTDSYDSSAGDYASQAKGSQGDIYTSGEVTLQTNSVFNGSIMTAKGLTMANNATINGSVSAQDTITLNGANAVIQGEANTSGNIVNQGDINGNATSEGLQTDVGGDYNGATNTENADLEDIDPPPACKDSARLPVPPGIAGANNNAGIVCTQNGGPPITCSDANCNATTPGGSCTFGAGETEVTLAGSSDPDNPIEYYFEGLEIRSNTDIIATGYVDIYINGDLLMNQNAGICSSGEAGSATVFGDGCEDSGNGSATARNSAPADILLYVYGETAAGGQNSTVDLTSNNDIYGRVYAPSASMTNINASSHVYGSVVAGGMCTSCGGGGGLDANSGVSWDEALASGVNDEIPTGAFFYEQRECLYGIVGDGAGTAYYDGSCRPE